MGVSDPSLERMVVQLVSLEGSRKTETIISGRQSSMKETSHFYGYTTIESRKNSPHRKCRDRNCSSAIPVGIYGRLPQAAVWLASKMLMRKILFLRGFRTHI